VVSGELHVIAKGLTYHNKIMKEITEDDIHIVPPSPYSRGRRKGSERDYH
jgi:hypothetical protein